MIFLERIWKSGILFLDNIKRWNGKLNLLEESVSTHSYWVATFCLLLIEKISLLDEDLDKEKNLQKQRFLGVLLSKALLHDAPELFTGDVIHPVKYMYGEESKAIKQNLSAIEEFAYDELFRVLFGPNKWNIYSTLQSRDKVFYFADRIVKLADWMSCYFKSKRELELNNYSFEQSNIYSLNKIKELVKEIKSFKKDFEEVGEMKFINWDEFDDIVFNFPIK